VRVTLSGPDTRTHTHTHTHTHTQREREREKEREIERESERERERDAAMELGYISKPSLLVYKGQKQSQTLCTVLGASLSADSSANSV
jgi:hypothetical protein